jgi:hypothetical protein
MTRAITHAVYVAAPWPLLAMDGPVPDLDGQAAPTCGPAPNAAPRPNAADLCALAQKRADLLAQMQRLRAHPRSRAYSICEARLRDVVTQILQTGGKT